MAEKEEKNKKDEKEEDKKEEEKEEKKKDEKKEDSKKDNKKESSESEEEEEEEVEIPEKFEGIVNEISDMSILDLSELVDILEKKFGVSAQAPVAAAPAQGAGEQEEEETKSEFDIELQEVGDSKIEVIKVVRDITEKGLKEAKGMVDDAPQVLKSKVAKEEAEEIKERLEEAGATVELK